MAKRREYTPARQEANARYDAKTYKKINIALRREDDADILENLERAKRDKLSNREWLRKIFEGQK